MSRFDVNASDTLTALSELLSTMVKTMAVCAVFCRLKICDVSRNVCLAVDVLCATYNAWFFSFRVKCARKVHVLCATYNAWFFSFRVKCMRKVHIEIIPLVEHE
jgi:hypothetical protein